MGIRLLVLFFVTIIPKQGRATHAMGGDVWYECNGGNTYTIYFAFYRDCDGVNAPNTVTIDYGSSCQGMSGLTLTQVPGTGQDITPVCPGQQTTCGGGNFPGVEKYVYSATVTLLPCNDWVFSTSICCRNNAITNIQNPGGEEMYLQATLNNLDFPCNSSPSFSSDPVPYVCVGETFCFNHGAIDVDGDSLVFHQIVPYDQGPTDPVVYVAGYDETQPISSSPLITFNPNTGDICMTPTINEVSVTALEIEHWSNGQLVGTVMRDIQIHVINCNNELPTVDGIDASNTFTTNACAGTPINFTTTGNDNNAGNLLTMSWNAGIPNSTFNITGNGTTNPQGVFSWTPTLADVSNTPYCFTVTIEDDQCPLNGFQIYSFCITVNSGNVVADATATQPSCSGICDGQATVTASGGGGPYTFSDDGTNYTANNTFNGLCAGMNYFYVMDANGCVAIDSVLLVDPAPINLITNSTDVLCNGGNGGLAGVTASGGTAPYTYAWSNGPTTSFNTGLTAGNYTVTVTDANGCTEIANVTINEPTPLTANAALTNPSCDGNDGQIVVTPAGGTGPYTYNWSQDPLLIGNTATNLSAGSYVISVEDANGCTVNLNETLVITGSADASFISNGNQCLDVNNFNFTNQGSTGAGVNHEWDFGDGVGTSTLENPNYVYTAAGTYTVRHIAIDGLCSDTVFLNVTVHPDLTISTTTTSPLCFGNNDGTIDLTVVNGSPNYGYSWSTGAITEDLSNLPAGIYTVIVSDLNGCLAYDTVGLTNPIVLSVNTSENNATCAGVCDGSATATPAGGTAPYNYSWTNSGGQTTQGLTNLCAGEYVVTVTDDNGCIVNDTSTILYNDTVVISTTVVNSSCNQTDGSITANPSGGTGPYNYVWTPTNQFTQTATSLGAGTHYLTVTDANGCSAMDTTIISDVPGPTATISASTDVLCNGDSTGSATVLATGGTGVYTYSWNPSGGNTATEIGLPYGFYTVTVTDDNNCITQASVFIDEPNNPLSINVGSTNSNCGNNDGSISVVATGGTPNYSYQWSDSNGPISTANSLAAGPGMYYIQVTDANGCVVSDSVEVIDNPAGTLTTTSTDVTCFGLCNGTASAAIAGGVGPFQFVWDDPAMTTGQTVVGLCAGTYTVTVTDSRNCVVTASVTIATPTALNSNILLTTPTTCFGGNDGTAIVTASGGTTPYQFQWDANAGSQTNDTVVGLAAGNYIVVVSDSNGCTSSAVATVQDAPEIVLSVATTNAHCNQADGTASVTVTGGVPPLTYAWSGSPSTGPIASGFAPGAYTVTVTDSKGCIGTAIFTIGNTPAGVAAITNTINPTCAGGCNGLATVSMSGTGTAPYTYSWNNASSQTTVTATGLCANTNYTVTVTDDNGCTSQASVILSEPAPLTINLTPNDAICHGECTGSMQSSVSGGTAPYTYQWNDPALQTTATAVNLCPQTTFTLTVSDINGCTASQGNSVGQPTPIEIDSTVTDAFCGQSTGSACINITGGIPGYDVNWIGNGSSNLCQNNITAGTYLVQVTDANDCPAQTAVTVSDISGPTSTTTINSHVTCAGGNDGQATIFASGGTAPYTYQWDANANGQISPTASNLEAGSYTYTVTDSAGCITSGVVVITEPQGLNMTTNSLDPICAGSSDGIITTTVFGGVGPYTYSWSHNPALNAPIATNLPSGSYSVTITDANGCSLIEAVILEDPLPNTSQVTTNEALCAGSCTGSGTVTPLTGLAPFSYSWNDVNQQTTQTALGLCSGNYEVIVQDNNGCTDTVNVFIDEPDSLLTSFSLVGNASCFSSCDGFAEVSGQGGTPPYAYQWSNGGTTQMIQNLCAGSYAAIITDANGCSTSATQSITQPNALNGTAIVTNATCNGVCDGNVNYVLSGGTAPYTYQWNDPAFQTTSTASGLCAGNYTVQATDAQGCVISNSTIVGQPTAVTISSNVTNSACGQSNGQACVNVGGGTSPYSYQWNDPNSQTTACALNVPSGSYTIVVTDDNNCVASTQVNVTDISGPVINNISVTDVSCNGAADGEIEMGVSGGTLPYQTFAWTNNTTGASAGTNFNPILSNAAVGCYTLNVVDDLGCSASLTDCIGGPQSLNLTLINISNASCNGNCDGAATVIFAGGTAPYNLLWSTGQTSTTVNNLCAGSHSVTITDANGCTQTANFTITEPNVLAMSQISGSMSTTCANTCDGVIQIATTGGTAPYNYNWTPGTATGNTATNLCPGVYAVQVTDANGCTNIQDYTITAPTPLDANLVFTPATCGLCNATAALTPSGGVAPYSIAWLDGQTTSIASNVCPGYYAGTITDDNGCQLTLDTMINNIAGPSISSLVTTDLSCNGDNTGTATVTVTGGSTPYTYQWNPGLQTTPSINGLAAGNYCVEISDANGCIAFQCETINQPNELNGVADQDATVCYGDSAQIWASASGGTSPYTFTWLAPHNNIIGSGPHYVAPTADTQYCFDVVDANGCTPANNACVDITVTPPIDIDVPNEIFVCTGENFDINSIVTGGNGDPFIYSWHYESPDSSVISNSPTLFQQTDLGWYYLIVNDGCSLEAIDSTLVSPFATPTADINVLNPEVCFPELVYFAVSSDSGTYYEWDFNSDGIIDSASSDYTSSFTYSGPGTYDVTVTITSPQGCQVTVTDSAAALVHPQPNANFNVSPTEGTILDPVVNVFDQSSGAVSWLWDFNGDGIYDDNQENSSYEYNTVGQYEITLIISDTNNCTDTTFEYFIVNDELLVYVPNAFTPDGDNLNEFFFAEGPLQNVTNFRLDVFDRWGLLIWTGDSPEQKWDGTYNGQLAPDDVYVWQLTLRLPGEVNRQFTGHVTLIR
jgi:gliding motility-associated-like protein